MFRRAREEGLSLSAIENFEALSGQGVRAEMEGLEILIGNKRLMESDGLELKVLLQDRRESLADQGKTLMFVARGGKVIGLMALADTLKEHSLEAVA